MFSILPTDAPVGGVTIVIAGAAMAVVGGIVVVVVVGGIVVVVVVGGIVVVVVGGIVVVVVGGIMDVVPGSGSVDGSTSGLCAEQPRSPTVAIALSAIVVGFE